VTDKIGSGRRLHGVPLTYRATWQGIRAVWFRQRLKADVLKAALSAIQSSQRPVKQSGPELRKAEPSKGQNCED
jgi:hypothetical protein